MVILPNGWVIQSPPGVMTQTDTMPQGAAVAPDGRRLAVVEAGFNTPSLRIYSVPDLEQLAEIPLPGAFGRPVWVDGSHVLVAGANADAIFNIDVDRQTMQADKLPAKSYPVAVALDGTQIAVATDGDTAVRIGSLPQIAAATPIRIGGHIGGLTCANGTVFASNSSGHAVVAISSATLATRRIATGLHPTALLAVDGALYVTQSDDDSVGVYNEASGTRRARIEMRPPRLRGLDGLSPNALAQSGDAIFVSLGAANAVAVIRHGAVVQRIAAGWYPTDMVPIGHMLYIIDGKGEGSPPNPRFDPKGKSFFDYIAALQYGSIRAVDLRHAGAPNPIGAVGWQSAGVNSVLRPGGPIKHVFFILKENRSYDEVLGDVRAGNGDPKLTWFGAAVTPNEHAIAARFGLFDNAYASGEVSESGHYWADAAFVNDYVERTWPAVYANRDDVDNDLSPLGTALPKNGYIWQSALKRHVSFRVYGELPNVFNPFGTGPDAAKLVDAYSDKRYVSWNLNYSDLDREREWRREFDGFVHSGTVPQFEFIWLPNDHTAGSRVNMLTPVAMVAQNDYALGRMIDAISHSPIWKSSVILVTEDDAQDGPDHVSDQRTTIFVVSPYSRGGVQHGHYATVSLVRTEELLLGLPPLSVYDATAVPLSAAFTPVANARPYDAIPPRVSITARNTAHAYGAKVSAAMDLTRPDAVDDDVLNDILAHNRQPTKRWVHPDAREGAFMYTTTTTAYGIAVTVEGRPTPEELKVVNATLMDAARTKPGFSLLMDLSKAHVASDADSQAMISERYGKLFGAGMRRLAIVVSSATVGMQVHRLIAQAVGEKVITERVRMIDPTVPNWRADVERWLAEKAP
ncbi:MAG TPA: alkaline phosphatase family protein [Verrucomicrobiae bacterium]|nr:alkaline phosphatase family protein [Verrucomicrobiae bacterium]